LTPLLTYIPKATLASLVINAVLMLFHPREVFKLWRINRHDGIVAVIVFTLALLTKPDYALLLGIVISLILFLWKTMHPRIVRVTKKPEMSMFLNGDFHNAPSCPQILELRCENAIYFANAEYTAEHIMTRCNEQEISPVFLLLDLQAMPFIDISGVDELRSLQEELLSKGTKLTLMGIHFPVREVFKNSGFWEEVKENLRFHTRGDAYKILFDLIDHEYCKTQCSYALFNECHTIKNCPPDKTYCRVTTEDA
jgi:SulP family sulfate permease